MAFAPPSDLAVTVARFFVTRIRQCGDTATEDLLLNDAAIVQIPIAGRWSWQTSDGLWHSFASPTLFGPRGRAIRIRAEGEAMIAGFAVRPGGWPTIDSRNAAAVADCVEPIAQDWAHALAHAADDTLEPSQLVQRISETVRARIAMIGAKASTKAALFEALVRLESNTSVMLAATSLGMNPGTFDRFVRRHFGHPPKTVLRRSRFLDMAGVMHGLAAQDEDALASVRFYDASHLNREFRMFVDMTPGVFARTHTPLLNAELAARRSLNSPVLRRA